MCWQWRMLNVLKRCAIVDVVTANNWHPDGDAATYFTTSGHGLIFLSTGHRQIVQITLEFGKSLNRWRRRMTQTFAVR